ncbi:transcription initiation factor TFIID subunit 7 [Nematocida sp. AWRm77]|nr:transcription initiation factor TFIID subunit 7 [Nematocida sp. AWRm77]
MEDQFIIRPPESLQDKINEDVKNGALNKISIKMNSSKEGVLMYEGNTYPGCIVDLPCIIESHKTLDNRQFIKIADISKMLVFSEDAASVQKKADEASLSGITPPMAYVRNRRFRKRLTKAPLIEEIEKAVAALLQKDQEAVQVEVQVTNKDGSESEEDDMSSLAAEIEMNLLENERVLQTAEEPTPQLNPELDEKKEHIKEILSKIQEKKQQLEKIANPILKKRFQESITLLEQEQAQIEEEIQRLSGDQA